MDPDLEIAFADAEKSIQKDLGLAAHYQTSAEEKQRLLDIARTEHANAEQFKQLYLQEQAKNAQLSQRIADLERNGTTYHVGGNYYEAVHIGNIFNSVPKSRKSKRKIDLTDQLDLWTNLAISM